MFLATFHTAEKLPCCFVIQIFSIRHLLFSTAFWHLLNLSHTSLVPFLFFLPLEPIHWLPPYRFHRTSCNIVPFSATGIFCPILYPQRFYLALYGTSLVYYLRVLCPVRFHLNFFIDYLLNIKCCCSLFPIGASYLMFSPPRVFYLEVWLRIDGYHIYSNISLPLLSHKVSFGHIPCKKSLDPKVQPRL